MTNLFGTDGIRGPANQYPLIPEAMVQIGTVLAQTLCRQTPASIIIGKDTRVSGDMLEAGLAAGIFSAGVNAISAGILPTPGVACLVPRHQAAAGVVISASHNPFSDNGIKLFDHQGYKLTPDIEAQIEQRLAAFSSVRNVSRPEPGCWIRPANLASTYQDFLKQSLKPGFDASTVSLVLDCSNGATYDVAPRLFKMLGAEIQTLADRPDGRNINDKCGSEHPHTLAQKVVSAGARLGLAFDGDGDRLIAVDETGGIVTGDQLLLIFAEHLKRSGRLQNNCVVSTVMSNMGLTAALQARGIRHHIADVGDRQVMAAMRATGAVLGGEDSGHIILADRHTTGDGLLSALLLLEIMVEKTTSLSRLASGMSVFPQILLNVNVTAKPALETLPEVQQAVGRVSAALGEQGRVLVRYSGTQPLCRVMVEGPRLEDVQRYAQEIGRVVERCVL